MRRRVIRCYITGLGAISSAGANPETIFDNCINGICRNKLVHINNLDKSFYMGLIDDKNDIINLSNIALCQSLIQASLTEMDVNNAILLIGSTVGGINYTEEKFIYENETPVSIEKHWNNYINEQLNKLYKFRKVMCFSTACTSSGNAIKFAKEIINSSQCDIVIAGGVDTLCMTTVHGFNSLNLLSSERCKPFDEERCGMNLSEGAAFIVVESEKSINKRKISPLVELKGCGASSATESFISPSVVDILRCMQNAINDAKINIEEIDYINAHGTGTVTNDEVESEVYNKCSIRKIPFSSTKHVTGHLLGAASALEAIISIMALLKNIMPPNNTTIHPISENLVISSKESFLSYVLSNSLAFGGNNVSLIFSKI